MNTQMAMELSDAAYQSIVRKGENMKHELELKPSYWASVSGGKDSLYMLKLLLDNRDWYPLDGVIHFELEIDYPFIKDVVDYMEKECLARGVKFVRIKPRNSWEELYNKYGFPSTRFRWCNGKYKLDAAAQLEDWLNRNGYYTVSYIGYCKDERQRYEKRNTQGKEIYPLVEFNVYEKDILDWAKHQPIFNNFYITHRRCGCMYCPMVSRLDFAYLYKYYPDKFQYMIEKMKETEKMVEEKTGKPFSCIDGKAKYNAAYLENSIKTNWIHKLNEMEKEYEETL